MDIVQGIILFILGVGASLLAYFAWQHTMILPAVTPTSTVGDGPTIQ